MQYGLAIDSYVRQGKKYKSVTKDVQRYFISLFSQKLEFFFPVTFFQPLSLRFIQAMTHSQRLKSLSRLVDFKSRTLNESRIRQRQEVFSFFLLNLKTNIELKFLNCFRYFNLGKKVNSTFFLAMDFFLITEFIFHFLN